jgi:hypothetical protein
LQIVTMMVPLLFKFILLLLVVSLDDAYKLGDAVDTIVLTDSNAEDALRSQMPLFGQPSTAMFQATKLTRFSLSFEEGVRPIPWVETVDAKGQTLEQLEVTFLFSRSGEGAIYGISSKPTYGAHSDKFLVQYNWVEQEVVDPMAAIAIMFVMVVLVSVVMMISACGISIDGDVSGRESHIGANASYSGGYEQPSTVPKWD